MKETIPLTTATERVQFLGTNLPKEAKDLDSETPMKEIKDDPNGWREYHVLGLQESLLPK